jgi:hypothetical protein
MEDYDKDSILITDIATNILAEYGLSNDFVIVDNSIVFNTEREQFLYELHGGSAIYKRILDTYSQQQWDNIVETLDLFYKDKHGSSASYLETFKKLYLTHWKKEW